MIYSVTITVLLFGISVDAASKASPPMFELSQWKSNKSTRLQDFSGEIVVLDFFAHWCLPCNRTTQEMQLLQEHYSQAGGNLQGIPVNVITVNIDQSNPRGTAAFIKRNKPEQVVEDPEGDLMKQLGGLALPYLVIIDGRNAQTANGGFEIIHRKTGAQNSGPIRTVIDTIGSASDESALVSSQSSVTITHEIEPDIEAVFSSDILLTQSSLRYGYRRGDNEWDLSVSYSTIDLDYKPVSFDFLGSSSDLSEQRYSFQSGYRRRLTDRLTLTSVAGLYDGFTDYRSLWLSEYYAQQFSLLPDYENPDPKGWNASIGIRWEYLPTIGFLDLNIGTMRDNIAPAYDIDQNGLFRGRETLYSNILSLATENIWTTRIRSKMEFQTTDTTDRDRRFSFKGSINVALGNQWVLRTFAGYTEENPDFEATYFGGTLEYELTPSLFVNLSGRYYEDTGEIENSLLFSSAAPGLEAYQVGLGLHYHRNSSIFKLYAAPYFTSYDAIDFGTLFFQNLYQDRDWGIIQAAYQIQF